MAMDLNPHSPPYAGWFAGEMRATKEPKHHVDNTSTRVTTKVQAQGTYARTRDDGKYKEKDGATCYQQWHAPFPLRWQWYRV